jgi:hypothetical protein
MGDSPSFPVAAETSCGSQGFLLKLARMQTKCRLDLVRQPPGDAPFCKQIRTSRDDWMALTLSVRLGFDQSKSAQTVIISGVAA